MSRAMMSIGMILIGVQFFINSNYRQSLQNYYNQKSLFYLSLIFLTYFLSGLYSENTDAFFNRLLLKLPLLFIPLGFAALPDLPKNYLKNILYLFILLCLVAAISSIAIYISNFEAITESYKYAQVLPNIFGINHTRFSLMLVIALFSSLFLYQEKHFLFHKFEIHFIFITGIILLIFVHILSVRTGLLAFYGSLLILVVNYAIKTKKYLIGSLSVVFVLAMPIVAYFTVPTIKNKIEYMSVDVKRFINSESVDFYSDGNRLLSIKIGLALAQQNPLSGVGIGDIEGDMFSYYEKHHPEISPKNRLIPHNQFVYVFTACGITGLILFMWAIFYPFFSANTYSNTLFLTIIIVLLSSYISEATLENQLGVALFITFYSIGYYSKKEKIEE